MGRTRSHILAPTNRYPVLLGQTVSSLANDPDQRGWAMVSKLRKKGAEGAAGRKELEMEMEGKS